MPYSNLALDADRENGPAARSFAADAYDCRGITAEPRLVRRAVQLDQCAVDRVLVGNRHRVKGRGNLAIDIRGCAIDAQTTENRSAIT
jgi:hypothetical protein